MNSSAIISPWGTVLFFPIPPRKKLSIRLVFYFTTNAGISPVTGHKKTGGNDATGVFVSAVFTLRF
jgi:hypothetical protein